MKRWTISIPDDVAGEVKAQLDYGDNRSAWVVDAIEQKLADDEADLERDDEAAAETESPDSVEAAISVWEPPAELEVNTERARDAVREAVAWLSQQDEPMRKAEIVAGAYDDGPLSERIWWARAARPGLQSLKSVAVEGRKYRWVGEKEE